MDADRQFKSALAGFQRSWRGGIALATLVGVLALGLGVLILFGLGDALWAYSDGGRRFVFWALLLCGLGALAYGLRWIFRVDASEAARAADEAAAVERRSVEAAQGLMGGEEQGGLYDFLKKRALGEAAEALEKIPRGGRKPRALIRKMCWALAGAGGLGVVLFLISPAASSTAVARVLFPTADIPPHSPYVFKVEPTAVEVFYGEDVEIVVEIEGGLPDEPVWLLTRVPGSGTQERQLRCFQETESRFAQTLEGVTQPVEFAFTTGRARSEWKPVEILLQPKIAGVEVTVTPPRYTGAEAETFVLGRNKIAALVGSEIALRVQSNRHLGSGVLTTEPVTLGTSTEAASVSVEGSPVEGGMLEFRWDLVADVAVTAEVRDLRGTVGESPLTLTVEARSDERPDVTILSPPPLALATPSSVLPLEVEAADDLALEKVELVRGLFGYHDRFETIAEDIEKGEFSSTSEIDLAALGAEAGQVLELVLEATDSNPSLLGISSSEPSLIQIITEEQYAEKLRIETTIEEFKARYEALDAALEASNKALEKLAAAEEGSAEQEAARREAKDTLEKTRDLFADVAQDFPIYDTESDVASTAIEIANALQGGIEQLDEGTPEELPEIAEGLIDGLSDAVEEIETAVEQSEELADIHPALDLAAKVRVLRERQAEIVETLTEVTQSISRGDTEKAPLLGSMAEEQANLKQDLADLIEEMVEQCPTLPEQGGLRESAMDFLDALEGLGVDRPMAGASALAREGRAAEATGQAAFALSLLDDLFQQQSEGLFGQMAGAGQGQGQGQGEGQGQGQGSGIGEGLGGGYSTPNMAGTLEQMLRGLIAKHRGEAREGNGSGRNPGGTGNGGGSGGEGGYSAPDANAFDAPAYGPPRMRFKEGGSGRGSKGAGGLAGDPSEVEANAENLEVETLTDDGAGDLDLRRIPERYRDAVKEFFSETEPQPTKP